MNKKRELWKIEAPAPAPVTLPKQDRILESSIENAICHHAKRRQWYVRKFTSPNHRSVPDRMLITPHGRVLFIEFKRPGETLTDDQRREICRLLLHEQDVAIFDNVKKGKVLIETMTGHQPERTFLPADYVMRLKVLEKIGPGDALPMNQVLRIVYPRV